MENNNLKVENNNRNPKIITHKPILKNNNLKVENDNPKLETVPLNLKT